MKLYYEVEVNTVNSKGGCTKTRRIYDEFTDIERLIERYGEDENLIAINIHVTPTNPVERKEAEQRRQR